VESEGNIDPMTPEENEGFSVVDKRKTSQEAEPEVEEAPDESDAPPSMEQDAPQHGMPKLGLSERLLMSIDILHQQAWISMGLVADPSTGEIDRDLDQARIAIDSAAFLAGKLEGYVPADTLREVKRVVSDMQVNFVRQLQQ